METFSESLFSLDSPSVPSIGPRHHTVHASTVQQEGKQMYRLHVPGKETVGEGELTVCVCCPKSQGKASDPLELELWVA